MKSHFLSCILGIVLVVSMACSSEEFVSGFSGGSVSWVDSDAEAFSGAFGWNSSGVLSLFSGTTCDNLDSSVDINNGSSNDPCAQQEDGFSGEIIGKLCNSTDDTEANHTVVCNDGIITDNTRELAPLLGHITIFVTETTSDGDLGGRAGADASCISERPEDVDQGNIRALISFSESDEVRDFPTNFGLPTNQEIQGQNGTVIDNNFADSLDDSLLATPEDGGILPTYYWTGSDTDGSLYDDGGPINCDGFTTNDSATTGAYGYHDHTDGDWLYYGEPDCDETYPLLCVAFD